jgi:DNA-binding IclR family transcriptional regulator
MKQDKATRDYAVPAVDRMLDIAEFLVGQSRPYGISELARELDISTNSVFRILRRLDDRGYVELDEESGGYQLGTGFFRLGMLLSTRFDLRSRARPHLDWLARQTGETATIQIPDGDRVLVLDAANPPGEVFFQIVVGSRFYYHCNAMGKCILAFLDDDELRTILPARLPKLTPNTITDRKGLNRELAEVRSSGVGLRSRGVHDGRVLYWLARLRCERACCRRRWDLGSCGTLGQGGVRAFGVPRAAGGGADLCGYWV